jgi:hypothetical protein
MLEFFTPILPRRFGDDDSSGFTAGKGREAAGEADLRIEGEDPKEERRLCDTRGGSIGRVVAVIGVPGVDGTGEPTAIEAAADDDCVLVLKSGGAGLFEDMRLAGRSIL